MFVLSLINFTGVLSELLGDKKGDQYYMAVSELTMSGNSNLLSSPRARKQLPGSNAWLIHFLVVGKKILRIFYDMWKLYEIQISVSTDKVLLEHSHFPSFMYCGRLTSCWAELGSPNRDPMASKA